MKRGITARQLTRALTKDGYRLKRSRGSHHVFSHPDGGVVVVPYTKDSDTFPYGTLRQIASAVRWTDNDLRRHAFL